MRRNDGAVERFNFTHHLQYINRFCTNACINDFEIYRVRYVKTDLIFFIQNISGGSRKKYLGGLAPHHLGGNNG